MDWEFVTDEILELLETNSLTSATVVDLDKVVESFIKRLKKKYAVEDSVVSIDSEIDFDLDEIDIFS